MKRLGVATLTVAAFLCGCSLVSGGSAGDAARSAAGSGDGSTASMNLPAAEYVVEGTAGNPGGCVKSIELIGTNGYPVVTVLSNGVQIIGRRPNDPPPSSPKPDQVVGSTLVAGSYSFRIKAPAGCHWSVRVHLPVPGSQPDVAVSAYCSDLPKLSEGQFVKITGRRVPLPAANPLAGDDQIVQPEGFTIEHYAIGVDDGSAVCTVLWTTNQPQLGSVVAFTAEILTRNRGYYLGLVDP